MSGEPRSLAEIMASARLASERAQQTRSRSGDRLQATAVAARAEMIRIREARFAADVPLRFASASMDDLPPPRGPEIDAWCSAPEGRNLILSGPVGCGKTHAAIAALRRILPGCASWKLCSVLELLEELRPGGPEGALERACSVSVLLLDDLGAERPTDWTAERLAAVIDRRWLDERPIIATTNLTLGPSGELIEALGERSYSRLVGSGAVALQLQGSDRRRS